MPIILFETLPVIATRGTESRYAVAMPVTRFVAPSRRRDYRAHRLARRPGVAVGGMAAVLLVVSSKIAYLVRRVVKCVEQVNHRASGIPEDGVDPLRDEGVDYDLRPRGGSHVLLPFVCALGLNHAVECVHVGLCGRDDDVVVEPLPVNTRPSSAWMRTVTSPRASMPRVAALTANSCRSPWTVTTWSMAL